MHAGKRDLQFERVIAETTADMKLTRDDDFLLRVVQLSELLAIRHCVFLMGPTGSARTEVYKVCVPTRMLTDIYVARMLLACTLCHCQPTAPRYSLPPACLPACRPARA